MSNVKVWNRNHYPFSQEFEGENLYIPAGHFIIMDFEKAHKFKGTYSPIELDAGGVPLPKSYKKIEIEQIGEAELPKINQHRCQACGFIGLDKKDLDDHINEKHIYDLVDNKEREKRLKALQS